MSSITAERLRVTVLSVPVDDEVRMSFSSLRARRACLIEIEADGLVGIGESWINYPEWGYHERVATLCDGLARHVLGRDVSDPAAVHRILTNATLAIARQWGAPGPIWQAISGVDLALWDLKGKAEAKSVAELLSKTRTRTRVPAYASGIGPDRVEDWCQVAVGQQFKAAKVKLGFNPTTDRATLKAASTVLGSSVALLADVNQGWTLEQASDMAPLLEDHQVQWLEEPLVDDRLDELELLAARTGISIATGENVYGLAALREYVDSPAVDTIQPDLTKCGGITVSAQVSAHAAEVATFLAPHCYSSAIGIAASLQLAAAFPGVGPIEFDIRDNPLRTDLLQEPLQLVEGELVIPRAAGLGIELNNAVVERYRICMEERNMHEL